MEVSVFANELFKLRIISVALLFTEAYNGSIQSDFRATINFIIEH